MEDLNKALTLDLFEGLTLRTIEAGIENLNKEQLKESCKSLARLYMINQKLISHLILNQR